MTRHETIVTSRRGFLATTAALVPSAFATAADTLGPLATLEPYAKIHDRWGPDQLLDVIYQINDPHRLTLLKALDVVPPDAPDSILKGKSQDIGDIQGALLRMTSNVFVRQFQDRAAIDYHGVVNITPLTTAVWL